MRRKVEITFDPTLSEVIVRYYKNGEIEETNIYPQADFVNSKSLLNGGEVFTRLVLQHIRNTGR